MLRSFIALPVLVLCLLCAGTATAAAPPIAPGVICCGDGGSGGCASGSHSAGGGDSTGSYGWTVSVAWCWTGWGSIYNLRVIGGYPYQSGWYSFEGYDGVIAQGVNAVVVQARFGWNSPFGVTSQHYTQRTCVAVGAQYMGGC